MKAISKPREMRNDVGIIKYLEKVIKPFVTKKLSNASTRATTFHPRHFINSQSKRSKFKLWIIESALLWTVSIFCTFGNEAFSYSCTFELVWVLRDFIHNLIVGLKSYTETAPNSWTLYNLIVGFCIHLNMSDGELTVTLHRRSGRW